MFKIQEGLVESCWIKLTYCVVFWYLEVYSIFKCEKKNSSSVWLAQKNNKLLTVKDDVLLWNSPIELNRESQATYNTSRKRSHTYDLFLFEDFLRFFHRSSSVNSVKYFVFLVIASSRNNVSARKLPVTFNFHVKTL